MKKVLVLILVLVFTNCAIAQEIYLMPLPKSIQMSEGQYQIPADGLQVKLNGNYSDRLINNAEWFKERLSKKTTIPFLPETGRVISIHTKRPGVVKLGEDESYQLIIDSNIIKITAETDLGAIHALETLLQLASFDENGHYFPALIIDDSPRFPWRGLMLDVCRHFLPIDVVKRNIDGMSAVKLNVLHLHLTEDQGFRVESKVFPQLHEKGSNGEYFTQDEIREIIRYADLRGIRVMPEFDMPGHTSAWMVGMPELASAPGPYHIEKYFGVFKPTIDPTKESTYIILEKFFQEMAELFPDDYMHIGGDEVEGYHWNENVDIQKYMKKEGLKSNHELQAYFNKRLQQILSKNSKKMMGWDEIYDPSLPKDIVIHSWRGYDYMYRAAKQGYQSVLSNGYYIDLSYNAITHYLVDPLPDTTSLTIEEKKRILGGEAPMWAELVDVENVDSRIWPRTAAIAERFWSPNPPSSEFDMYRRLQIISQHLEKSGLRHMSNREPMMLRLAGIADISALMTLANAVEPVKGYKRHGSQLYTTYHPLSRFVDISLPDAPDIITFRLTLNEYLKNKSLSHFEELNLTLKMWQQNHALVQGQIIKNPNLLEIKDLSENLGKLASITSSLLNNYHYNKEIPSSEILGFKNQIEELSKPIAEMELPLVRDAKLILSIIKTID